MNNNQHQTIYTLAINCLLTAGLIGSAISLIAQNTVPYRFETTQALLHGTELPEVSDSILLQAANFQRSVYASSNYDSLWLFCNIMEAHGLQYNKPKWIANAWHGRAKYYSQIGHIDSAFLVSHYVLSLVNDPSDELTTRTLGLIGRIHANQEELLTAIEYMQQSVELGMQHHHQRHLGPVLLRLADTQKKLGRYLDAIENLNLARIYGSLNQKFYAQIEVIRLLNILGFAEEAQSILSEIQHDQAYLTHPSFIIQYNALAIDMAPSFDRVRTLVQQSMQLIDSLNLTKPALPLHISAARAYKNASILDTALFHVEQAIRIKTKLNVPMGDTGNLLAEILFLRGEYHKSLHICRQLLPNAEQYDSPDQQQFIYHIVSQNFEVLNQPDSALYYVRKKEAMEEVFDQSALAKASMSAYLKLKSAEEREALQAAKEAAEREALMAQTQSRLYRWGGGLLGTFFALLAVAFYLFSRHKSHVAEQLSQLNQALSDEQLKLQTSNQKLRRFSGIVSHDILSSLDFVLTAGNVLVKPQASKEQLAQYANLTKQSSQQLKEYCLGLLREARGEHSSDQDLTDPMPILQKVLTNFELPLQEAGVQVHLRPLSPARLPAPVVEQLFLNLVSNVVRYGATAQQPTLRIWEDRFSNGTRLWVVEDNGSGISEPLRRALLRDEAKQVSSSKGQGLGLSLLRESLQNYKASLLLGNNQAGGTRITIVLPEQAEEQAPHPA